MYKETGKFSESKQKEESAADSAYFKILARQWEQVNQNSLEQIHKYNEFKRQLRKQFEAD